MEDYIDALLEYLSDRRTDTKGMETKAEEWITDEWALNKKGNKLSKYSGKFRCKTIDRKDNIFGRVCKALGVNY